MLQFFLTYLFKIKDFNFSYRCDRNPRGFELLLYIPELIHSNLLTYKSHCVIVI